MAFSTVYVGAYELNNKRNAMSIIKKRSFDGLDNQMSNLAIDMYEENGNVIAKMDVPGIDSNDIHVEIEDGQLHVFGERKIKKEVKEKDYYNKEIRYGSFDRLISLPSNIQASGVSYKITDGVLTVIIPKK